MLGSTQNIFHNRSFPSPGEYAHMSKMNKVEQIAFAIILTVILVFTATSTVSAGKPTRTPTPTTPPGPTPTPAPGTPIQVFGAWTCGNHYCDWSLLRDMAEFDTANHWLIDRGDGRPSVNLIVLAFVN